MHAHIHSACTLNSKAARGASGVDIASEHDIVDTYSAAHITVGFLFSIQTSLWGGEECNRGGVEWVLENGAVLLEQHDNF